jgi:hypothetical protein
MDTTSYTGYIDTTAPSGGVPVSRADALARKRRLMQEEEARKQSMAPLSPDMTPRARDEMRDIEMLDRVNQVTQDPRYRSFYEQANPAYQQKMKQAEQEGLNWNKAQVLKRKTYRDISDRDLQWQAEQAKITALQKQQDAEVGLRKDALEEEKRRFDVTSRQQETQSRIAVLRDLANSNDPITSMAATEELSALMKGAQALGGSNAPSQPASGSFVESARLAYGLGGQQDGGYGPEVGPMARQLPTQAVGQESSPQQITRSTILAQRLEAIKQEIERKKQEAQAEADARAEELAAKKAEREYKAKIRERDIADYPMIQRKQELEAVISNPSIYSPEQVASAKRDLLALNPRITPDALTAANTGYESEIKDIKTKKALDKFFNDKRIQVKVNSALTGLGGVVEDPWFGSPRLTSAAANKIGDTVKSIALAAKSAGVPISEVAPFIEAQVLGHDAFSKDKLGASFDLYIPKVKEYINKALADLGAGE